MTRTHGTVVTLIGLGIDTQGAVHCHQTASVDGKIRKAQLKEKEPLTMVNDTVMKIEAIISE